MSDGSTIKHIGGCRSHVFLYQLTYFDSYLSFLRLTKRAPELLDRISSQLNTGLSWKSGSREVRPPSIYFEAMTHHDPHEPALYPFRFRSSAFELTAHEITQAHSVTDQDDVKSASVLYIPLTETGLNNSSFVRSLVRHILRAFVDPQAVLLLRLPAERQGEQLSIRIARFLRLLAASQINLPRIAPSNVFLLPSDLTMSAAFQNLSIVLHESFEFWRHPRSFYEKAVSITVEAAATERTSTDFLPHDIASIYGGRACRRWLDERGLSSQPQESIL